MLVEKINRKDSFEREIIFISVSKIEELDLKKLPEISKYFTLFIANNEEVNIDKYLDKANELINSGLAHFCAWGNNCEQIHDLFDEEIVSLEIDQQSSIDDNVIMTTWHKDESLKEALWFFLMTTSPTEKYYDECKTAIVLKVGDSSETHHLFDYIEDQNWLDED